MISFAHSFWSKPLLNNKFSDLRSSLAVNLTDYALSAEYIHKQGYRVVLYTDAIGAEIFSPIPYDDIIVLENTITDNYHFAASFKFIALENMPLGDVLIDGDMFLSKGQAYEIIEHNNCDVLVTLFEPKENLIRDKERNIKTLNMVMPFGFEWPYETPAWTGCDGWYNTSLMMFNNSELKEKYIEQYKYHVNIIKDADFQEIWPDIVLEQRHLTQLCRANNYKVHVLIEDFPSSKYYKEAMKIGFTHLGAEKQVTQEENALVLQELNPDLYTEIRGHINMMVEKYSNNSVIK